MGGQGWLRPGSLRPWVSRSPGQRGGCRGRPRLSRGQTPRPCRPRSGSRRSGPHGIGASLPGNLWCRQGVTPSYPQGTSWEHASNNVRRVSVGPLDQVWATGAGGGRLPWGRGLGGGSGFLLWSPRCRLRGPPAAVGPGLQRVCVPGLGHRRQSPGEPKPEPGNCVSPHGCAAPGAHGAGLGLWHRGEQGWARGGCAGLGLRALRALGWEAPGRAPQESNRLEGWSLPLDPWQPRVTPPSPFRGAGITCPSGPVPPGPPGARPRRRPASGEGSWASPVGPRRWPVPRRRPPILSAVEAASPHLEQV